MNDKVKWSSIAYAAVYIGAGIALLLYPGQINTMFCDLFGIALIIYGIINIVVYFLIDIRESLFRNDFSGGIIKILLGIMVIYHKSVFQEIIPFLLAIAIISSGFSKLQDGVDASRIGYANGWQFVALATVSIIGGVVLMFNVIADRNLLLQVAGAFLLYSGLTDLYATLSLSGKIKKFLAGTADPSRPKPKPEPKPAIEEPGSTAQYVNWNTSAEGMEIIREDNPREEVIVIPPAEEKPAEEKPAEIPAAPEPEQNPEEPEPAEEKPAEEE